MPRAIVVVAIIVLLGGDALAGDGPSWIPSFAASWRHSPAGGGGCCGDSPLCPELAWWLCQPSHCKSCWSSGHHRSRWNDDEVPIYPPLPYGSPPIIYGGPSVITSPVPAAAPAPAPGPTAVPATPPAPAPAPIGPSGSP
jgi:hypothetical protein